MRVCVYITVYIHINMSDVYIDLQISHHNISNHILSYTWVMPDIAQDCAHKALCQGTQRIPWCFGAPKDPHCDLLLGCPPEGHPAGVHGWYAWDAGINMATGGKSPMFPGDFSSKTNLHVWWGCPSSPCWLSRWLMKGSFCYQATSFSWWLSKRSIFVDHEMCCISAVKCPVLIKVATQQKPKQRQPVICRKTHPSEWPKKMICLS